MNGCAGKLSPLLILHTSSQAYRLHYRTLFLAGSEMCSHKEETSAGKIEAYADPT